MHFYSPPPPHQSTTQCTCLHLRTCVEMSSGNMLCWTAPSLCWHTWDLVWHTKSQSLMCALFLTALCEVSYIVGKTFVCWEEVLCGTVHPSIVGTTVLEVAAGCRMYVCMYVYYICMLHTLVWYACMYVCTAVLPSSQETIFQVHWIAWHLFPG